MGVYKKPSFQFDGKKFMARYSLGEFDFWDDGQGNIVTKKDLTDAQPTFEAPDPPQPTAFDSLKGDVDTLKVKVATLEADLKTVKDTVDKLPKIAK